MYARHYLGIGAFVGIRKRKNGKVRKKNKRDVIRTKDRKLYKEEGDDRFSELPDSLILYILSLLGNIKQVIKKTCLLSKRWQFLWTNMSEIELHESSEDTGKISSFVNCVGRLLDLCSVNHLHRLYVGFYYYECFIPNLDSLVQSAVEKNVKDISLSLYYNWISYDLRRYELHQMLYSHSTLTTLSINACSLTPRENIIWKSMKSLSISYVYLPDCVMEKILSGCPVLEALRLEMCSGFTRLNIFSKTFTKLEIRTWGNIPTITIDISAPYARELKIESDHPEKQKTQFRLKDIMSLVRVSLDFYLTSSTVNYMTELLQSVQYVKELELRSCGFKSLSKLADLKIPPSTRRCLTLNMRHRGNFRGILLILKSSLYLETLTIEGSTCNLFEDIPDEENNIDLVFDHLKTIKITFSDAEPMMKLAQFLLMRANVLQEMNLSYYKSSRIDCEEVNKTALALPKASPEAVVTVTKNFYKNTSRILI